MQMRTAIIGIGLVIAGSVVLAQAPDPALTAAIAARDKAGIDRDAAAMAKYTSDDYASIAPNGARMTKQQRVDGLKAPPTPGSKPLPPMVREATHMYGTNDAVVRMKQANNRQLQVWVKKPSGWQAVAIHIVPDDSSPPPPPLDRPNTAEPSATIAPPGLSGDAATVFAVHKQIQDAFFTGNRAGWDKNSAPEHVRLNPGGLIRFGAETGTPIDGKPRRQPKFSNITVQVWGQVAVVRWLETGNTVQWLTRVFAKTASRWQAVATASSFAATPPIQSTQP
jgi:hypothetical protein